MPQVFAYRSRIAAPAEQVFAWHERPGAFTRLAPPWQPIQVIEQRGGIQNGGAVTLRIPVGPLGVAWTLVHTDYIAGRQFCDVQQSGPFRSWRHTHRMEPDGPDACWLDDRIEYELPLGPAGAAAEKFVNHELQRLFVYRHAVTVADLAAQRYYAEMPKMKIAVSGASGLIGSSLVALLATAGHDVRKIVRGQKQAETDILWNPAAGQLDRSALAGCDAVVHLAGEGIADHRWTAQQKEKIRISRVQGTRLLADALAALNPRPQTLVCASAIGYYGDRGDERLDEASPPGHGFLPEVCVEWEQATRPAADAGIRVVNARFGVVLSPAGGALKQMLPPFRLGLGGRLGNGRQYMSWIGLDDATGALQHALATGSLRGPLNVVAPQAATNLEFTKALGRVLHRPTLFPVPAAAARIAFGELADALLLASTRVYPARLLETGYKFRHADLEDSLRHVLGKAG